MKKGPSTSSSTTFAFQNSVEDIPVSTNPTENNGSTLQFKNDYDEKYFSLNLINSTSSGGIENSIQYAPTPINLGEYEDNAIKFKNDYDEKYFSCNIGDTIPLDGTESSSQQIPGPTDLRNDQGEADAIQFINDYDETSFRRNLDNTTSFNEADHKPLFLFLRNQGPTTSILSDPVTNELFYHIRHTGRSHLSQEPDLVITRAHSGDIPVGQIRLKHKTAPVKLDSTGQTHSHIHEFSPSRPLHGQKHNSKLVWITKTKEEKQPAKKYEWSEGYSVTPKLASKITDILVLELVDQARPRAPLCVVRLYDTEPTGRFEIWTPSACVDRTGGDWAVLDELVLSAYANMEVARLKMRQKKDRLKNPFTPAEVAASLLLAVIPG